MSVAKALFGIAVVILAVSLSIDADTWWQFATVAIEGVFGILLITMGVRELIADRAHSAHRSKPN